MYSNWTSKIKSYMKYIRTKINVLYKYKYVLLTLLNKYQIFFYKTLISTVFCHGEKQQCSCGSVVEHCVSNAKVVGSIPREHTYWQKTYNLNAL